MGGRSGARQARARGLSLTVWRLVHSRWQNTGFSGEGAALYPGRWNKAGERMVYLADSLALAVLETRAHLEAFAIAGSYIAIEVFLPEEDVAEIGTLEGTWRHDLAYTRSLGSAWLAEADSLALQVPSAIVPSERNILLNPAHTLMNHLHEQRRLTFHWDNRLF